jgi:serralysin
MADITGSKNADKLAGTTLQDNIQGHGGDDYIDAGDGDDTIMGGSDNDTIFGGDGNDYISAGTGNDVLDGGNGNDTILAGEGDDTVYANGGNDNYQGGKGFDTIDFSNAIDGINIDLSKGLSTGADDDIVQGFERVVGSSFGDVIKGSNAADVIVTGEGINSVRSLGGADVITGGSSSDYFEWRTSDILDDKGNHRGVDTITNFDFADGLDVSEMLVGQTYGDLSEVVRFEDSTEGSMLQVRVNGAFVNVAFLEGQTLGTESIASLVDESTLLI